MASATPLRVAEAALAVVVAAAAILWFANGLHAHDLQDTAVSQASQGRAGALRAISTLRRAARFNADPLPRIDEARLLMSLGRWRDAVQVLRAVAHDNPGSVPAVALLAAAAGHVDQAEATHATLALQRLYGHLPVPPELVASLAPPAHVGGYTVNPNVAHGYVEGVGRGARGEFVVGWAVRTADGGPVDRLLVLAGDHVVGSAPPDAVRRDVPGSHGLVGYRVPLAGNPPPNIIQVYAVTGNAAAPLPRIAPRR